MLLSADSVLAAGNVFMITCIQTPGGLAYLSINIRVYELYIS